MKKVVDVIAKLGKKLVLIERLSFPFGLALSGGKVEDKERPIRAAKREFTEETGLTLRTIRFYARTEGKSRDPRGPTKSRVYIGVAEGIPKNENGKTRVVLLSVSKVLSLPLDRFAFDHGKILQRALTASK